MKNVINFVMVTILLASFGMAVAGEDFGDVDTIIMGTVYDANTYANIANANVKIICNGYNQTTVSGVDGSYDVAYPAGQCPIGTVFSVEAEDSGRYGYASATVYARENDLNLGIAYVAIVPEFGFFMGMLTLLSAVGIFFIVRR